MAVKVTYFVHSITTDNELGIATGTLPGELSEEGLRRARALKNYISQRPFDAVFASDLKRAVETAEIWFGPKVARQDARLRECDYGEMNGGPHSFKDRMGSYIETPFPGGESYQDVEARIADFLNDIAEKYEGKHLAIVAHQAPQLALDVLLCGKSWQQAIDEDWRKTGAWQPGWEYTFSKDQRSTDE